MTLVRGVAVACMVLMVQLSEARSAAAAQAGDETLHFGRFGDVRLYRSTDTPKQVVLFVSGDGGWNLGVIDMARALAVLDAVVVGIDIRGYLKELQASSEGCSYPAADLQGLSLYVQKKLDFPEPVLPFLVGYSSGATLVYATLVQAPPNTFGGAISIGFCPDLPLNKPLCKGDGLAWTRGPQGKGFSFLPASKLSSPWIALHGAIDQVCNPSRTAAYVSQVQGGELIAVPKVGHGFSVQSRWMPKLEEAFGRLVRGGTAGAGSDGDVPGRSESLDDLPLVEVPAQGANADALAVVLSGDGGWAGLDKEVGDALALQGIPVAGLNSLKYFWTPRDPDGAARDLERILRHYLAAWKKQKAILIGYSLGADVLPFMASRLPGDLRQRIRLIAFLGLARTVRFEFHLSEWLGGGDSKDSLPVRPELDKLRGQRILCLYGEEEDDALCRDLPSDLAQVVSRPGGHHFGRDYEEIARRILEAAR
jgi:type IV secretory pathway VirJ component